MHFLTNQYNLFLIQKLFQIWF